MFGEWKDAQCGWSRGVKGSQVYTGGQKGGRG